MGSVLNGMVKAYWGFEEHGEGSEFGRKREEKRFYKGKISGAFWKKSKIWKVKINSESKGITNRIAKCETTGCVP